MDAAGGDLEGAMPERLLVIADELRVLREDARRRARGTADERLRRVEAARVLVRAESGLRDAERRLGQAAEQLEQTPAWRRRERSDLRRHSARAREDIERHRVEVVAARDDLARLGPGNDDPAKRAGRLSVELARVEERLARRGRGVPDRGREPPPPAIELSR